MAVEGAGGRLTRGPGTVEGGGADRIRVSITLRLRYSSMKKNSSSSLGVRRSLYVPPLLMYHRARRVVPMFSSWMRFEPSSERPRM